MKLKTYGAKDFPTVERGEQQPRITINQKTFVVSLNHEAIVLLTKDRVQGVAEIGEQLYFLFGHEPAEQQWFIALGTAQDGIKAKVNKTSGTRNKMGVQVRRKQLGVMLTEGLNPEVVSYSCILSGQSVPDNNGVDWYPIITSPWQVKEDAE